MKLTKKLRKLIASPIQVIDISNGVVVKRGATELMITGDGAAETVKKVLDLATPPGISSEDIRRLFTGSSSKLADKIIQQLLSRRLLVEDTERTWSINRTENAFDVFNWQLGEVTDLVIDRLTQVRITIIGVNVISKHLVMALEASGCQNISVLDHPAHRNQDFRTSDGITSHHNWPEMYVQPKVWSDNCPADLGDCLIATSDYGERQALSHWNTVCLTQGIHFLPVTIRNMVGYVGPMVIPGETACYECLIYRQLSHSLFPDAEQCIDRFTSKGRTVTGFHPSMAVIVGAVAAFEIFKFYGFPESAREPGSLLDINLLGGSMTRRTVLKMPRCQSCSPFHNTSQPNLSRVLFTKQELKEWDTNTAL
ncbi:MAG: hypothetical protein OJF51_004111 [Nitrospira sp.]|jgi:bacteriocin biosynthesis cyclodehydratase domain-containing protein|nr:MAG: hypothetical protein OJF51_004111 [Nitrospira sp.]